MIGFLPTDSLIRAVIDGIKKAKSNYTYWTADELYLSYAPENFLTIHIAQEIGELQNAPEIFIDATIADILRCSLHSRNAFKDFMYEKELAQGTLSLTLDERKKHTSDNDSVSKAIIIVKNGVRNAKEEYQDDIHRICKMLSYDQKSETSLEFGAFAFYLDISSSARKKSHKRLQEIQMSFDAIVNSYKNLKSYFKGGEINTIENIGEWCVGCYVIEPDL